MFCMTRQGWLIQNNDASVRGRRTQLPKPTIKRERATETATGILPEKGRPRHYRSLSDATDIRICIAAIAQSRLARRSPGRQRDGDISQAGEQKTNSSERRRCEGADL